MGHSGFWYTLMMLICWTKTLIKQFIETFETVRVTGAYKILEVRPQVKTLLKT